MKKLILLVIFISQLIGCTTLSSYFYKIKPVLLTSSTDVTTYVDPDNDISVYKTFSIYSDPSDKTNNEIQKKQLSFFLRCLFEMKGYKFVNSKKHPDFITSIKVTNSYDTYYVPPETITVPEYVPGQTTTSYTNNNGTINTNSGNTWGNYYGTSTTSTYTPGYMTTQTYTRNGYTAGSYFPAVLISVYDGKKLTRSFYGDGVGTSDNPDERVSCQFVANKILNKFPNCKHFKNENTSNDGVVGIYPMILTLDGNDYVPVVRNVVDQGSSDLAGIKPYDEIISIDGKSTINKPFSEVISMLRGPIGTSVTLGLLVNNVEQDIDVQRVSKNETNKIKYKP